MSKKVPYIIIALLVLALLGAGATKAIPAGKKSAGNAARGQKLFLGTCALCHGENGRGLPKLSKNLVEQSEWMKQQTDAMLLEFVKEGRPMAMDGSYKVPMLPRGGDPTLTDEDLKDIIAYIRVLQQQKEPPGAQILP